MPIQNRARAIDVSAHTAAEDDRGSSGSPTRNRLLGLVSQRALEAFTDQCELMSLESGYVLYERESQITNVYFPETCVVSMVRRMDDGAGVEVGLIGCEGVTGISVVLGVATMPTQCMIQIAGTARRIPTDALLAALERPEFNTDQGNSFASVLHLYSQAMFEQVAQSAACNRLHSLEQRCARWLLMTHDRALGDELALTQEFLSYMLGVRRAGVTEAAGMLQRGGLITYRHGRIRIRDRAGLEAVACECYRVGVTAYDAVLAMAETTS